MKKFLKKIAIYSVILYVVCYAMQFMADKGLRNYNYGNYGEWNKIFNGTINSDIIVLGSSRALVQYDPKIIEDYSGLSCYNFGISGGRFIMQNAKWESFLAYNKSPEIVIQNLDIIMLLKEHHIFGKGQFLPYLSEPTVSENLEQLDDKIWLENVLPLYKYRGLRHNFILGIKSFLGLTKDIKSTFYKGFAGADKQWNQDFEKFKSGHKELTFSWDRMEFGFNYIKNLIKECRKRNIDLILVHSPMFHGLQEIIPQKKAVDSVFAQIAASNNIPFWNYSNDSVSYDKKYFYNSSHLNIKGAEIFSQHLAEDLRDYIINKKKIPTDLKDTKASIRVSNPFKKPRDAKTSLAETD